MYENLYVRGYRWTMYEVLFLHQELLNTSKKWNFEIMTDKFYKKNKVHISTIISLSKYWQ
jgi:hypothetical protein